MMNSKEINILFTGKTIESIRSNDEEDREVEFNFTDGTSFHIGVDIFETMNFFEGKITK